MPTPDTAILLIHCPDQPGLVHAVTGFILSNGGNVLHLDQHVDREADVFFMRVEWSQAGGGIPREAIAPAFASLATRHSMTWSLHFPEIHRRTAIFATKESHCLYDLLSRHEAGDLPIDIPLIISNHETLRSAAERFHIPFVHVPITPETREAAEARHLELLAEHQIDSVILARYMQIIGPRLISAFPNRILNIHHSFLPAFAGARPYHQAYERGVKLIGATSHYVTEQLDEGPIIHQDVIRVTHRDSAADLVRLGRDLEKIVLAKAVWLHANHQVLVYANKTIVLG